MTDSIQLVQAIIMPRSTLIGHTIRRSRFRQRYGVSVLAVYRQGASLVEGLVNLRFRVGDVILLQGPADRLGRCRRLVICGFWRKASTHSSAGGGAATRWGPWDCLYSWGGYR